MLLLLLLLLNDAGRGAVLAHDTGAKAAQCLPVIIMMQTTQWCQPPHSTHTHGPRVAGWASVYLAIVPLSGTIQLAVLCRAHINRVTCHASFRHAQ
jgi:hypothetical protein